MAATKRSSFGTRLWMNFSTYHGIFLEVATTEEHNKHEISVVGQSGCGLSINMKYVGKEQRCSKFWLFLSMQCSGDVEKLRQGWYALEREAVAWPQQRTRANKITSKLGLGLNFVVNVDFWVCNDDFNKKN